MQVTKGRGRRASPFFRVCSCERRSPGFQAVSLATLGSCVRRNTGSGNAPRGPVLLRKQEPRATGVVVRGSGFLPAQEPVTRRATARTVTSVTPNAHPRASRQIQLDAFGLVVARVQQIAGHIDADEIAQVDRQILVRGADRMAEPAPIGRIPAPTATEAYASAACRKAATSDRSASRHAVCRAACPTSRPSKAGVSSRPREESRTVS